MYICSVCHISIVCCCIALLVALVYLFTSHNACFVLQAVSIPRLVELAPPGTIDPSPFVYDSTMYAMAGLMAVSAVAHAFVRPVHPKYFERLSDANVIDVTPSSSTKSTAHELRPLMGKDR